LDFTIIQILESDFIDNYLEIDDSIWNSNYEGETIYCLEFPQGKDLKFDIGEIKKIENGIIKHNISTEDGSSGSPLISTNHKIIGIHKGHEKKNKNCNCGIFIKDIIMKIIENNLSPIKENIFVIFFYKSIKFIMKLKKYRKYLLISFALLLFIMLLSYLIFIYIPSQKKYEYYENGNIKYYGDMNKGLRNGYGISYYQNNIKEYEGFWQNGKYQGKGKKYNENKQLIYDGTWQNGKRYGDGISYYKNGDIEYIGTFSNDLFDGYGKHYFKSDKFGYDYIYEGNFNKNLRHGFGTFIIEEIHFKYIGEFTNDFIQGLGKMYFNETLIKKGTFIRDPLNDIGVSYNNGQMKTIFNEENLDGYVLTTNGKGILISNESLSLGRRKGEIILYHENGKELYKGQINDYYIVNGNGTEFYENGGIRYKGGFKNNLYHGYGHFYNKNGTLKYNGSFSEGNYHGKGTYYYDNGKKNYEGNYKNDLRDGYGLVYDENEILR